MIGPRLGVRMMMGCRTMGSAAVLALLGMTLASAHAAEGDQVGVVEKEQGAVESFFYEVWSTVSSMSPTARESRTPEGVTVTAGLRGAEGESEAMAPYWKGDLTDDPNFREELDAYQQALEKGRNGQPQALKQFVERHEDSDLAPNAQFALGLSHAQSGNAEAARDVLTSFRQRYGDHPLDGQAQRVLERIGG